MAKATKQKPAPQKVSDFDVMSAMSKQSQDIKAFTTIVGGGHRGGKKNPHAIIEVAISREMWHTLSKGMFLGPQTHICALYVVNYEQFVKMKTQLAETASKKKA
jgi:hypothetical protein